MSATRTVHPFEARGLGVAPFRCIGMTEERDPSGQTSQPWGTCDFCGTGIAYVFRIAGTDGKVFRVGSDCVMKTSWSAESRSSEDREMVATVRRLAREQRRAKQDAKDRPAREARQAAYAARQAEERAAAEIEKAREAARKAAAKHVGTVGARITVDVTVEAVIYIEGNGGYGWQNEGRYVLKFRDADGNGLVAFTANKPGNWTTSETEDARNMYGSTFESFDTGDRITIKATVKEHGSYQDEAQTVIQRIKLVRVHTTGEAAQ